MERHATQTRVYKDEVYGCEAAKEYVKKYWVESRVEKENVIMYGRTGRIEVFRITKTGKVLARIFVVDTSGNVEFIQLGV